MTHELLENEIIYTLSNATHNEYDFVIIMRDGNTNQLEFECHILNKFKKIEMLSKSLEMKHDLTNIENHFLFNEESKMPYYLFNNSTNHLRICVIYRMSNQFLLKEGYMETIEQYFS